MIERAYLDEHRAYLGTSGSGKSTTARGHVEQLLRERRHTCVTDHTGVWYGLASNAAGNGPGFDIPILGGRHCDKRLAFGAGDGTAIGKLVGDGLSAVIDLSGLRTGYDQRVFMRDFVAALRAKPPGHFQFVADEADEDVPEKTRDSVHFELAEDMIWIAKRGRSDGFVLSLITQRTASIANEALAMAKTIFAHQLISPADTMAFGRYVRAHGTAAEYREIMAKLPSLQTGERYVYSPQLHVLELGRSPMPETFDSSRTPGPGETKREPRMLAELDVTAIAAALQKPKVEATLAAYDAGAEVGQLLVEKDERIRALEHQVAALQRVNLQFDQEHDRYRSAFAAAMKLLEEARGDLALKKPRPDIANLHGSAGPAPPEGSSPRSARPAGGGGAASPRAKRPAASPTPGDGDPHPLAVTLGERMAAIAPARLTWRQLASMCSYSPDGGYFRAGKRDALARGLLVEEGAFVRAPGDAGTPLTRAEAFTLWAGVLPRPAPQIMEQLRAEGLMYKGRLAGALGYSADGGFFRKGLALLRQNGVTSEAGDDVWLADPLPGQAE